MNSKPLAFAVSIVMLLAACGGAAETKTADIKHAAPTDAFLAMYFHHNPERDYQREYYAAVWKVFQDEQIGQRLLNIVTSRIPADNLETAKSKLQELQTALEPINVQTLMNAEEVVVTESFDGPFNQVLFAVRLKEADAADCERGLVQACQLVSRWSEGKVPIETSRVKDATITQLSLPKQSPFQPAVARLNDILLVATNPSLLRKSLEQLQDDSAKSKFDDPRLKEALAYLPKPEDSLVFFDGEKLFRDLHGLADFIRGQAKNDEKAQRVAQLFDRIVASVAILDYEVVVETTEPGLNRKIEFGKLSFDYQDKLLGRIISQSKPIDNWKSWIPKDATAFALNGGINLHELYDGIVKLVQEEFPESKQSFEKFAALQEQVGVNLDRDILQSFSGESVSVTVPVKAADGSTREESVHAMKCSNPDKIRELLTRAIDALNKIPAVQSQQLKLEEIAQPKGFQRLNASIFLLFGTEPVIGFPDGWMMIASSPQAAEKVLAVRAGQAATIADAGLEKLGMDLNAAVYSVGYQDIGASVRHAADILDKVGAMAPMFVGMAAANAKPEDMKPVQEVIGLLPSMAKLVRTFDFFGHSLSVTRQGSIPGTYLKESAIEIRAPKTEK